MSSLLPKIVNTLARPSARPMLAAGVYDGLTAALAEGAGFDALWVSGFCISTSLGMRDANTIGPATLCQKVAEIRRTSTIPLIVDCDEGYGSIEATVELAKQLNDIGVDIICIEDSRYPKINSFMEGVHRELVSTPEFCEKISAVKNSIPNLKVISRTELLISGAPLSDAVDHLVECVAAGTDYVLIHSRAKSILEIREVTTAWTHPTPMITIPTLVTDASFDDYSEMGYSIVVFANHIMRAGIFAIQTVLGQIRASGTLRDVNELVSMQHIFDVISDISTRIKSKELSADGIRSGLAK